MRLSALDLVPVGEGVTSGQAIQHSLALARELDQLGFLRLWYAEHHNMPAIASTTPATMIALAAQQTQKIRVGSGGVMLPNHAPLQVAESFKMLEALHPGRIDLGIGRAPGTDQVTALALRRTREGIVSFHSPHDVGLLKVGTSLFGPIDRNFGVSAGAEGFATPATLSAADRELYRTKLRQTAWNETMERYGATGSHMGWTSRRFAARYLAPLIRKSELP